MSKKNDIVTITCYGVTEKIKRQDAIEKYLEGMMCCDGSERERYTNIYIQLIAGNKHCTDC